MRKFNWTRTGFSLVIMMFCSSGWLFSQAISSEGDAIFAMMKPLIGKQFKGSFPNSSVYDEQHFSTVYDGKFIRNIHFVKDETGKILYEGETIFARDLQKGTVQFWYWNTTGGYVVGSLVLEGQRIMVTGKNTGPANQTPEVKSSMWDISADGYVASSYFLKDGNWEEQWTMEYKASPKQ